MQMIRRNTFKYWEQDIKSQLSNVFLEKTFRTVLDTLQKKHSFSSTSRSRLVKLPRPVHVQWNKKQLSKILTFQKEVSIRDLLEAWLTQPHFYFSHLTALYYNELINQRPNDFYITQEISSKRRTVLTSPLPEFAVRQAFLKPARKTSNFFSYQEHKIFFLERLPLKDLGVVSKSIHLDNRKITFKMTNLERTFLDCVISPQYSGGIATMVSAFSNQTLNVEKLIEMYHVLSPIYPYWQSIGFLLSQFGQISAEKQWQKAFSKKPTIPFYVEHEAKTHWKHSPLWNIYYPQGVFTHAHN